MTKAIFLASFAVLALAARQPAAAQEAKQFAVEGAGRMDCAAYDRARADKGSAEFQRMLGFVEGYLSAANRYETNTFDLTPWHNAMAFDLILEGHCRQHTGDTLVSVVQRMVTGFRSIRVADFSPLIEVGDATHKTLVYETILKRSQLALKNQGLYQGPLDGKFTHDVSLAVAAFQRSKKLDPTGIPDPGTLWMLLNP